MYSKFRTNLAIFSEINEIYNIVEDKRKEKGNFIYSFKEIPIASNNFYTFLNQFDLNQNRERLFLFQMIKDVCKDVELAAGPSAHLTFNLIGNISKQILKQLKLDVNPLELNKKTTKIYSKILDSIKANTIKPSWKDIEQICSGLEMGKKFCSISIEATKLAGLNGKISLGKSKNKNTYINLKNGYTFSVVPCLNQNWEAKNIKCLIVDGVVESVSEIHHILEKSSITKIPLLIVCRGYHQDVLSTIFTNNKNGTFNIMPFSSEFDIENVNIMNDISVVCGTDLVSSLKGEILNCVDYDKLQIVDGAKSTSSQLVIFNDKTINQIQIHIKNLQDKKNQQSLVDVEELYDKRIKSLIGSTVEILVSGDETESQMAIEQIDNCLRFIKGILRFGIFDVSNLQNSKELDFLKDTIDICLPKQEKIQSSYLIINSIKKSIDLCSQLCLSAGMILTD